MSSLSSAQSSFCRQPSTGRTLFRRLRRWWIRHLATVEMRGDPVRNCELGYRLAAWRAGRRGNPEQSLRLREIARVFRAARN